MNIFFCGESVLHVKSSSHIDFFLNAFDAHVLHLLDPGVGVSEQSQVFLCVCCSM